MANFVFRRTATLQAPLISKHILPTSLRLGIRTIPSRGRAFHSCSVRRGPWDDPVDDSLHRYVVIVEDYPNPGALARRLEVRDAHLEDAKTGAEAGRIGECIRFLYGRELML